MDNYEVTNERIARLVDSARYRVELDNVLADILATLTPSVNESTLASIFELNLWSFIKNFFGLTIDYEKEAGKNELRHKFIGRADAISNGLVIEYKRQSKLASEKDKQKAIVQASNYLLQIKETVDCEYQAVVTDGRKVCFIFFLNGTLKSTAFRAIGIDEIDLIVKSLIFVDGKKFISGNIHKDFSIESSSGISKTLAKALFASIINESTVKTTMLYSEWESMFHLSANDNGQNFDIVKRQQALSQIFECEISRDEDYKALFALHTTYAIIVKLIACKVISKVAFDDDIVYYSDLTTVTSQSLRTFFESVEDGYVFSSGGIRNLLEGDFFSWYTSSEQWNEQLATAIINAVKAVDDYSTFSFANQYNAVDIFKDLYMDIIPHPIRHSLGEYFTPAWLADNVVDGALKMIDSPEWKAIDPCCGSGVFLMNLINRIVGDRDLTLLSREEKNQILSQILSRVYGIDINPTAVLTARVSYLLAISPFLDGREIEIPVYLGDSADIPKTKNIGGINCYEYTIHTEQGEISVVFPCKFVDSNSFTDSVRKLQTLVKAENPELLYDKIIQSMPKDCLNSLIYESVKKFTNDLVDLHKKNWDGIWIRIATNFMMVARLKEMDIIVGNPPWVKWEFLPQYYSEKIKKICADRRIFSGQTYMGAISLNICALIANVTASTWLKKDGVLAFLMPKTLMTQDSYAGFRTFYTSGGSTRLFMLTADDWSEVGNVFKFTQEKFMTYYYGYNTVDYSTGIPITRYSRSKKTTQLQDDASVFSEVEPFFNITYTSAYQLDAARTGFTFYDKPLIQNGSVPFNGIIGENHYKARSGVEFTPAEVYFISPVRKSVNRDTYIFKSNQFKHAVHKTPHIGNIELEKAIVRPVIKGPCIKEFRIEDSDNYCIFPYAPNSRISLSISELDNTAQKATEYLLRCKEAIEKQSKRSVSIQQGSEFYALSKVGLYTFAPFAVTFRDNTKLCAAVVKGVNTPWEEVVSPICAKHAPYISMDKGGNPISEDEAYFIAGILNTQIVQEYFMSTYSSRSFSIDFNIKLPKYDGSVLEMHKINILSREAHDIASKHEPVEKLKSQIQQRYLKICERYD